MGKKVILVLVVLLVLLIAFYFWTKNIETPPAIGGDRDSGGCLIAAGYAFDGEVGACIREFEMTSDIKEAAKLAVDYVGREYGLTVASFNSYEERGAYDIFLRRISDSGSKGTVRIRNWKVIDAN